MISPDEALELELNVDKKWQNLNLNNEHETKEEKGVLSHFGDNKALRMMKLMGYESGLGLGKNQQGITLPVELKSQLGTKGLGLNLKSLRKTDEKWDFSQEYAIEVDEKAVWLHNRSETQINVKNWAKEGKPSHQIENEFNFCEKSALFDVIRAKDIFDELDIMELSQARGKANPFETVKSVFFMNRAALKMANIDASTNFMFTKIDQNPNHRNDQNEPFYFADVCAGPGGFTEYILWRKRWFFKGFGLTLREENDFKVYESACASPTTFLPLYGAENDGNVTCPANIRDFCVKVRHETGAKGVHFMMSDGGFCVDGKENLQEILSKNIYIAQCLLALEIVRARGHFVTKLFDLFTPFSIGLLYLMYRCFEKVAILKPNTSRPANSERYFICCNRADNVAEIRQYLRGLVDRLWELKDVPELDITEVVPLHVIKEDGDFFKYIYDSNTMIARKQTVNLRKLACFCRNPSNEEYRQEECRRKCLEYWKIPDLVKKMPAKLTVEDLLTEAIDKREILLVQPREIVRLDNLQHTISDVTNWHYTFMHCSRSQNICSYFAALGGTRVFRLHSSKWVRVKNLHLVRGTLLYGEIVKELFSSNNTTDSSAYKHSLHVIDALRLGDVSLADLKFNERRNLIKKYCKSVNHEFRAYGMRVRAKAIEPLLDFEYLTKNGEENYEFMLPTMGFNTKQERYTVNSVLFIKTNENQSFYSSYVLRLQLFVQANERQEENDMSLEKFSQFLKNISK